MKFARSIMFACACLVGFAAWAQQLDSSLPEAEQVAVRYINAVITVDIRAMVRDLHPDKISLVKQLMLTHLNQAEQSDQLEAFGDMYGVDMNRERLEGMSDEEAYVHLMELAVAEVAPIDAPAADYVRVSGSELRADNVALVKLDVSVAGQKDKAGVLLARLGDAWKVIGDQEINGDGGR